MRVLWTKEGVGSDMIGEVSVGRAALGKAGMMLVVAEHWVSCMRMMGKAPKVMSEVGWELELVNESVPVWVGQSCWSRILLVGLYE